MNTLEDRYYSRQMLLPEIGSKGQSMLRNARVLVIGAGGLGCPVLEFLARAGVGSIGIVDGDVIDISNLHRQSLYTFKDVDSPKADIATQVLKSTNPYINIKSYSKMLSKDNALDIIDEYDIVVDATDNYPTRYLVNDACVILNKPLVYGAIYRFEGQVSVFNLNSSATYRCLFPNYPKTESETNCATAGVIGILPGIIGLMQANEVIKIILKSDDVLRNRLLNYSAKTGKTSIINLQLDSSFDYSTVLQNGSLEHEYYNQSCKAGKEIDPEILLSAIDQEIYLIDVRNSEELPEFEHETVLSIPLYEIDSVKDLPKADMIVTFCKSGLRSKTAQDFLQSQFPKIEILNLKGGITSEFIELWKQNR